MAVRFWAGAGRRVSAARRLAVRETHRVCVLGGVKVGAPFGRARFAPNRDPSCAEAVTLPYSLGILSGSRNGAM